MFKLEKIQPKSTPEKEEAVEEKVEKPEAKITTFEKLRQFGRRVVEKIRGKSQETIASGEEIIEKSIKDIKAEPRLVEQVRQETGTEKEIEKTQGEIKELSQKTEEEVKEIAGEKSVEEKFEKIKEEQVEYLEEKLGITERYRETITKTEVLSPKEVIIGEAPSDLDLLNLSLEEKAERKKKIKERYEKVLKKIPMIGKSLKMDERGLLAEQEISTDQLVFIRADDYAPKVDESGQLKVLNAYDATNKKIRRLTNHYTLNHRVTGNNGGSWENKPYQFIIPGKKMIEVNGNPENLYAVDSFWNKSNTLPEGTVIIYEKGKKPEVPEELENKMILIERDTDINDKELVSLVLEQMGYSEIEGGEVRTEKGYENFDYSLKSLADKEGLSSTIHDNTWSARFDNVDAFTRDLRNDLAVKDFLLLYRTDKDILLPENVKKEMWQEIFKVFKIKKEDYPQLGKDDHDSYIKFFTDEGMSQERAEESFKENYSDEELSKKIEKSREEIVGNVFGLMDYEVGISKEKTASILKNIPKEAWQHIIDSGIIDSENEFTESCAKLYQEATGEELNTKDLKF